MLPEIAEDIRDIQKKDVLVDSLTLVANAHQYISMISMICVTDSRVRWSDIEIT